MLKVLCFILTTGPFIKAQFPHIPTSALLGVEVGARPPAFCDVVKESRPLMALNFTNTQCSPSDAKGSGVVNVSIIAPCCDQMNLTLFTPMLIKAMDPLNFDHIRFMGVLGTNYQAGFCGDKGNHIITWDQRSFGVYT